MLEAIDLFKKHPGEGVQPASGRGVNVSRGTMWFAGVLGAVFAVGLAFWAWHSIQEHFGTGAEREGAQLSRESVPDIKYPVGVLRQIPTSDGSELELIPGGELILPASIEGGEGRKVKVKPFYMDAAPVTNQQFVEFLNEIRDDIVVDAEAVKKGDRIYLYLGEAVQGYEPIIFKSGLFRVKHSGHSACPVVRVTAYGAQAYAMFYHRILPTVSQWLWAASEARSVFPESLFKPVEMPVPVMLLPENSLGIRGLVIQLGSWVAMDTLNERGEKVLAIIGGGEAGHDGQRVPAPVSRKPWEAFEEVGFRCARDIS